MAHTQAHRLDTTRDVILDVRRKPTRKQIRGAIRYNGNALLDASPLVLPLPKENTIAVYADNEEFAEAIAEKLVREGYAHASTLEGGIEGWIESGLPTEELSEEQPIPGEPGTGAQRL